MNIGKLIIIGLIIIINGCTTLHDERLIGTWISDKETTLCIMEKSRCLNERQRNWFEKNLGKLKIKYTKDDVTIWFDGEPTTEKLRIAAKDRGAVVLIGKDPFNDEEDKLFLIHFEDNDNYWVYSDLGNYVEYFTRLKNDDAEPINSADPKGRSAD
jgi:hypothetical protein